MRPADRSRLLTVRRSPRLPVGQVHFVEPVHARGEWTGSAHPAHDLVDSTPQFVGISIEPGLPWWRDLRPGLRHRRFELLVVDVGCFDGHSVPFRFDGREHCQRDWTSDTRTVSGFLAHADTGHSVSATAPGSLARSRGRLSVRDILRDRTGKVIESPGRSGIRVVHKTLAATEIVRRFEYRAGELVRVGQEEGTIRKHGDDTRTDLVDRIQPGPKISPMDFVGVHDKSELHPSARWRTPTSPTSSGPSNGPGLRVTWAGPTS